ncbi:unnamed protein product [Kuraishia capsulata CBS 1993]|uniref:Peptide N-acetyl-beta-D-glucosaminyl asparaginase amidase A N-terminal domain-containing protein n=1 Tax=Kuraishia capsulata CBS 1993 TaxID=1382522 RepID=W6MG67_9ASCO|nr:uncharacterized protein KUCA_T00000707001 [Kuraishia capsulata CBS 1993]CDK24741.1 unnamed protein product [Kuraishia capsulata CBS 1993]
MSEYPTAAAEKALLLEDIQDVEAMELPKRRSHHTRWVSVLIAASVYCAIFLFVQPLRQFLPASLLSLVPQLAPSPAPAAPTQVFEVLRPVTVPLGSYVESSVWFNATELADGISVEYSAPETFNFTGVALTLNFTAAGAQAPIIADVYIDDHPVWRTSTPNALGFVSNSSTSKNVTEFLSLFTENRTVSLQIVDGAISDLEVSLEAVFYNDSLIVADPVAPVAPIDVGSLFVAHGPADLVFPISNAGKAFQLPKDKFSVILPQLSENTTVAKISIFASPSEEEIRYYQNKIGSIPGASDVGPVRTLNVYVDSVFLGAISPNPAQLRADHIGESADAAKLWVPVAAGGAFDALSYDLDLTSVLPLLWADETTLVIEVVSPVKGSTIGPGVPPAVPHPVPAPGTSQIPQSRWDLSGNLLAWESSLVNASTGAVILADSLESGTGMVIAPPGGFTQNQIVRSRIQSGIETQLNFTLADASVHNLTAKFNTSGDVFAITQTKMAGASSLFTLIGSTKVGLSVTDSALGAILDTPVYTFNASTSFPMIIKETKATIPVWGPPINASLEVSVKFGHKVKINGVSALYVDSKQNGTVDYLGVSTDSKVMEISDASPVPFTREVTVEDGIITKDSLVATLEAGEWDDSYEEFQFVLASMIDEEMFEF